METTMGLFGCQSTGDGKAEIVKLIPLPLHAIHNRFHTQQLRYMVLSWDSSKCLFDLQE